MLEAGARAPEFKLQSLTGETVTLHNLLPAAPVLLAFFKVTCPVCQLMFPFLDRLSAGLRVYGISQDDSGDTADFNGEFGVTFPTLLDTEESGYPASNAYGLSYVPSLFLVEPDGRISLTLTGFEKKGMEELGRRFGKEPFEPDEYVPEWKSG